MIAKESTTLCLISKAQKVAKEQPMNEIITTKFNPVRTLHQVARIPESDRSDFGNVVIGWHEGYAARFPDIYLPGFQQGLWIGWSARLAEKDGEQLYEFNRWMKWPSEPAGQIIDMATQCGIKTWQAESVVIAAMHSGNLVFNEYHGGLFNVEVRINLGS